MSSSAIGRLVVGVMGHVDHGKTALVRALTGTDTDRLTEEKRRGISIALGFAHLRIGQRVTIDLIDMPGHERFVRTMIGGATGIDAVLLVVAANEGLKPQTVEHVDIASLLGLRRAAIAITKTDLATAEDAARVARDAEQLLRSAGLDPLPAIMTSAHQGLGIEALQHALEHMAQTQPPRSADGSVFLPIDRAFSRIGHGPVVTATLRGAPVAAGDTLELLPAQRRVRVRAVQVHGEPVERAFPGQRVALNLRDVEIEALQRGMVLAAPGALTRSEWLTVSLRAVGNAPPLPNGVQVRALLGTAELNARLRLLDRDVLAPGESGFAQLHCAAAVALPTGEHIVLRLASPARTVAGGKVLESLTRRQRRHDPYLLQRLAELHTLPPRELIAAEVQRQSSAGTTLSHLARLTALAPPRLLELVHSLPIATTRSGWAVWQADLDRLLERIPALLAHQPGGASFEQLLAALPEASPAVLTEALNRLIARKTLQERGKRYLVPRPNEERERIASELDLAAHIAQTLRRSGLTPPNPGSLVTSVHAKRAVDRLLRERIIVRAVDRAKGREMLFHRDAIAEARRRLAPLLEREHGLLVTEIGAALGISRKYTMPLLDHLDSIRFTRRVGDRRVRGDAAR